MLAFYACRMGIHNRPRRTSGWSSQVARFDMTLPTGDTICVTYDVKFRGTHDDFEVDIDGPSEVLMYADDGDYALAPHHPLLVEHKALIDAAMLNDSGSREPDEQPDDDGDAAYDAWKNGDDQR
jgi:hypothetical protein